MASVDTQVIQRRVLVVILAIQRVDSQDIVAHLASADIRALADIQASQVSVQVDSLDTQATVHPALVDIQVHLVSLVIPVSLVDLDIAVILVSVVLVQADSQVILVIQQVDSQDIQVPQVSAGTQVHLDTVDILALVE